MICITYSSVHLHDDHASMRSVPPSEEVERWATNMKHSRLRHVNDKEELYRKLRQKKRAAAAAASDRQQQNRQALVDKELSSQATPERKTFDDVLNEKMEAIKSNRIVERQIFDDTLNENMQAIKSNRIVLPTETTIDQQQASHRQLFISDKPIVVKDLLYWKEAEKTHSFLEEQESKDGFTNHAFNQFASDRLGYFRKIPDTRHTL